MNDPSHRYLFQRRWFWLFVIATAGLIAGYEFWFKGRTTPPDTSFITQRYHVPQEAVTALTIKSADAIQQEITDDELVLGVTIGSEARAYPLNMMYAAPQTKVLNDTLAGRSIAVSWCEKCMSGAVFDRQADGKILTFAVFGSLWRDTIVLYDLESWTQWSQWDGAAKLGPYAGQKLQRVPSVIVDWKSWRTQHPGGSVALLADTRRAFDVATFAQAESFLLIGDAGDQTKAWDLAEIRNQRVVNDTLAGAPVLAVYLETSRTARLFARLIQGEALTFTWRVGQLRDTGTDTTWDPLTGRALSGPLQGQQLAAKASRLTTRAAWKRFVP